MQKRLSGFGRSTGPTNLPLHIPGTQVTLTCDDGLSIEATVDTNHQIDAPSTASCSLVTRSVIKVRYEITTRSFRMGHFEISRAKARNYCCVHFPGRLLSD